MNKRASKTFDSPGDEAAWILEKVRQEEELGEFPPGGASGGSVAAHRRRESAGVGNLRYVDRETLGRIVRETMMREGQELAAGPLVPWDGLIESDREICSRIGEAVARVTEPHGVCMDCGASASPRDEIEHRDGCAARKPVEATESQLLCMDCGATLSPRDRDAHDVVCVTRPNTKG